MANLKNFLNPNIRPGAKFDLYLHLNPSLNRELKIGDMVPEVVESLHFKAKVHITWLNELYKGPIEIEIDNETSPTGIGKIILKDAEFPVDYKTEEDKLIMHLTSYSDLTEVTLKRGDGIHSWFGVGQGWFRFCFNSVPVN